MHIFFRSDGVSCHRIPRHQPGAHLLHVGGSDHQLSEKRSQAHCLSATSIGYEHLCQLVEGLQVIYRIGPRNFYAGRERSVKQTRRQVCMLMLGTGRSQYELSRKMHYI